MPMNSVVLRDLIRTKVEAATGNVMPSVSLSVWEAVAEAIIEHITTQAQVTVTVASVTGVTVGAGVSGPGTGTGTIT